eukprot:TRINITY_DN11817_c0_g1_i1.p1 TRINITY_DN11817_c0_g1~~TRINITY_DN11817_c0_g1_i1.p1  ORF type:complete len:974 (-),score=215.38 TRINITY_DN11817_c0_g1_i1:308-3229(-)
MSDRLTFSKSTTVPTPSLTLPSISSPARRLSNAGQGQSSSSPRSRAAAAANTTASGSPRLTASASPPQLSRTPSPIDTSSSGSSTESSPTSVTASVLQEAAKKRAESDSALTSQSVPLSSYPGGVPPPATVHQARTGLQAATYIKEVRITDSPTQTHHHRQAPAKPPRKGSAASNNVITRQPSPTASLSSDNTTNSTITTTSTPSTTSTSTAASPSKTLTSGSSPISIPAIPIASIPTADSSASPSSTSPPSPSQFQKATSNHIISPRRRDGSPPVVISNSREKSPRKTKVQTSTPSNSPRTQVPPVEVKKVEPIVIGTSTNALEYFKKEASIRKWMLDVLSSSKDEATSKRLSILSDDKVSLQAALKDGVLLCKLMLRVSLDSRSIPKIHEGDSLPAFKSKENISFFLDALEELELQKNMKFSVGDLFDDRNMILVVDSLYAFGHFQKSSEPPAIHSNIVLKESDIPSQKVAIIKLLLSQMKMKEEAKQNQIALSQANRMRSRTYAPVQKSAIRPIGLQPPLPTPNQLQQQQKMKEVEAKITRFQAIIRGRIARKKYRKLVRDLAYRENVAREIFTTEDGYVKSLTLLKDVFLFPMNVMGFVTSPWLQGMLANVQVIINYSQLLLSKLKPRVDNWNPRQCLGDIFLQITNFLKVYTQYVKAYNQSLGELRKLKQEAKFMQFLKTAGKHPGVDKMEINSFLIMPVQRIPRYEMLLKDLLKHTDPSHVDYNNLKDASVSVAEVAAYVDEKKGEAENIYKVLELQDLFGSSFADLAKPHRRFVYENLVLVLVKNKSEERKLVLFNDILVLAVREKKKKRERYKVEKQSPIFGVSFSPIAEANGALRWGFDLTTANGSKLLRVYAKNAEELKKWEKQFADLSSSFSNSISTLQRAAPGSSTTLFSPRRKESVVDDAAATAASAVAAVAAAPAPAVQAVKTHGSVITGSPLSIRKDSNCKDTDDDEQRSADKRRGSM